MDKLGHYFIACLRALKRNKISFFLSITSLSAAFALSLIAGLLIWDAYTADAHWPNANQIYKPKMAGKTYSGFYTTRSMPQGSAADIASLSPDILDVTTYRYEMAKYKDTIIHANQRGLVIDPNFTDIFPFTVSSGDINNALSDPSKIIITEMWAATLFGTDSAIGKTMTLLLGQDEEVTFTVAAVVAAPPANSTFYAFQYYRTLREKETNYRGLAQSYARVKKDADVAALEQQFEAVFKPKYPKPQYMDTIAYEFEPLTVQSFDAFLTKFRRTGLKELMMATAYTLIIAILNYLALSTATLTSRTREIALRKSLGASRRDLIIQFLSEAVLINTLAYGIGLLIAGLILGPLESIVGAQFSLFTSDRSIHLIMGWSIALIIGMLTMLYPLYVALFKNLRTSLQGDEQFGPIGGKRLRFLTMTLQTTLGFALTIVAGITYLQTNMLIQQDKGFNPDGLMFAELYNWTSSHNAGNAQVLANQLRNSDGVLSYATTSNPPFELSSYTMKIAHPTTGEETGTTVIPYEGDYVETMQHPLVAGRIATPLPEPVAGEPTTTTTRVMVNEAFLEKFSLGSPDAVIGKCVYSMKGKKGEEVKVCHQITGVIANHHSFAGETPIKTTMFMPENKAQRFLIVRLDLSKTEAILSFLQNQWQQLLPTSAFTYKFVDDLITQRYQSHTAMTYLLAFTTIGSLLITVAGLYAIAKFLVLKRRREMAIRRVLGASKQTIMRLVIIDLMKPLLLGAIIGLPLGWFYARDWLKAYSIRIEPALWQLVLVGLIGLFFYLITVATEIRRASRIHPAQALHHE